MKKLFALILALLMALSCLSALADTVCARVAVDGDLLKEILPALGVEQDRLAMVDPVAALVNALGMRVTAVDDGAQIDFDLNGADALSLGFAADDAGISVVSTLFPNFLVTVSRETIAQTMEQFAANMPGGSGEGGFDANAVQEVFGGYCREWFEACAAAGRPGDPVTGAYAFEGHTFDTMVPVTVDVPAIADATASLMDKLLADPAAMAMLRGYAQGFAQRSGEAFNEETFEADFKAGFEAWLANFPDAVTAEYYCNGDEGIPFYLRGDSAWGDDVGFTWSMLFEDENTMNMAFATGGEDAMEGGFAMADGGMRAYFSMGGMYLGLNLAFAENDCALDLYFMNAEKPLATVTLEFTDGGDRTLPLDAEGLTALAVEDVMADMNGEAAQSLFGDIMGNGLGELTGALYGQVPEVAALMGMPMAPGADEQIDVNPEAWHTLADVLALEASGHESAWDDEHYQYIFDYAGTKWAVTADFSKELCDALGDVDFFADDREAQINAILGPCEITSIVDIETLALPRDELESWIGRTGQALLDAGWEYNGYTRTGDALRFNMIDGRIEYLVSFEGVDEAPDDYEDTSAFADATIADIEFGGNSYHFFDSEYMDDID